MLFPLQKSLIEIVRSYPGIGPGQAAGLIARDKSQTRRAMRDLAARGHLIELRDDQGYAYYPIGGNGVEHKVQHEIPPMIDATFRKVSPPISSSRALVPFCGSPQSFDSRLDATLVRNRTGTQSSPRRTPASPFAAALNNLFIADPSGDETLTALTMAWRENASSLRAAEARKARDRAAMEHERRAAARAAEDARVAEQERLDRLVALQAVSRLWLQASPGDEDTSARIPAEIRGGAAFGLRSRDHDRVRKFFVRQNTGQPKRSV